MSTRVFCFVLFFPALPLSKWEISGKSPWISASGPYLFSKPMRSDSGNQCSGQHPHFLKSEYLVRDLGSFCFRGTCTHACMGVCVCVCVCTGLWFFLWDTVKNYWKPLDQRIPEFSLNLSVLQRFSSTGCVCYNSWLGSNLGLRERR